MPPRPSGAPRSANPGGKLSRQRVEAVCILLKTGMSRESACSRAGLSRATFYKWLHDVEWVREMIQAAEAELQEEMLGHIKKAAANITEKGVYQWQAAAWLLERRFPEAFRLRTEQSLSNPDGSALAGPMGIILRPMAGATEEEVLKELRELDAIAPIPMRRTHHAKTSPPNGG